MKLDSFVAFLKDHQDDLNEETVFQMLQSHGRIDQCIEYAEMIERYDTVIVHYINKQEFAFALQKVTEIKEAAKRFETMIKYASIFINKCCKETIAELRRKEYSAIDIPSLMPAFMNIRMDKDDKPVGDDMRIVLDYITNHCINKKNVKSKTVHNMAFFFHSKINDPKRIIEFLEQEEVKKAKGLSIYFEVDYALNICKQNEKKLMDEIKQLINYIRNKERNETAESETLKGLKTNLEGIKDKLRVMKRA
jgi:hypothetical protein